MIKIKMFLIDGSIELLSRIMTVKFIRNMILNNDSVIFERVLLKKYVRILNRKEYPFTEIEANKKYIEFNGNYNSFKVFNMCYISDMLGKAMFAVAMGCYPKFSVLDEAGENYYNTYFKNVVDYSKLNKNNISIPKIQRNTGNPHWDMKKKEIHAYSLIYNRFFVLQDKIDENYKMELEHIKSKVKQNTGKIIGCVVRGTDYVLKKPSGHPIQPQLDEVINELKKITNTNDYIYLATEEKKISEELKKEFPNQIIESKSEYYDGIYNSNNINIAEYKFDRENDKFLRGFEYFRRVYCMSQCDCYVGG